MADPIDHKYVDPFWATRGQAIEAYAIVERTLCLIFASLTGMSLDVAGIIFFKIVNAGTLHAILEKLMRKKHGATYSLFWNSYIKILREVSERRNQIVHWNAVVHVHDKGTEVVLMTPNVYDYGPNTPPPITNADMDVFIEKCAFLMRIGKKLHAVITPEVGAQMDSALLQTWRDICLQPITCPPPGTHLGLCFPIGSKPENQPPPSQA
jgi:hypothetical protein